MGTVNFPVIDGAGNQKNLQAEQHIDGSLTIHSVPEVANLPASPANPLPIYSPGSTPQVSLTAAAATGAGTAVAYLTAKKNLAAQVSVTGAPTAVVVNLEGTIDGVNWFVLAVFDLTIAASGAIVFSNTIPVIGSRANLITLTGGTAPTVTATTLAA